MQPIFAVGDIHGQVQELDRVLTYISNDAEAGAPIVFLGDYVDRGPDSKAVIEALIQLRKSGQEIVTLKGNHEALMMDFLDGHGDLQAQGYNWLAENIGGRKTLESYGVNCGVRRSVEAIRKDALKAIPNEHLDFLRDLELMCVTDDHVFVHAGIRPGVPLEQQVEQDLIWIRGAFLDDPRDHGHLVVHGHTPTEFVDFPGNRLNLDGGAGFGRPLIAALLKGRDVWTLNAMGRARV